MANFEGVCKILEELLLDLMDKGLDIPPHLIEDLKSGRTMTSVYETESTEDHVPLRITPYLQIVEANLLSLAEAGVGKQYADEWQRRVNGAYAQQAEKPAPRPGHIPGIPRGAYWIRIQPSELIESREFKELLDRHELSERPQEDGYSLVFGKREQVSSFLKEIRQKVSKAGL